VLAVLPASKRFYKISLWLQKALERINRASCVLMIALCAYARRTLSVLRFRIRSCALLDECPQGFGCESIKGTLMINWSCFYGDNKDQRI